jgi:hypothetical protein
MKKYLVLFIVVFISCSCNKTIRIDENVLKDKIKGGLVGQILGDLNGLPYEEKFNNEPGTLKKHKPGLPLGAYTDDDTDIEWMYIYFMEKSKKSYLPYDTLVTIWKQNMNYKTWASNLYARQLMEIGFVPLETSNVCLNPWAHINVAGQFNCETFGLIAPAMPQTAGKIGLHYTRIVINNEPAQTTQFYTAMVSTAFLTSNVDSILQAGIAALDKNSQTYQGTMDAIAWYKKYPGDWIKSREEIRKKYYFVDNNIKSLFNHASIVSEYLYGQGDFVKTMEIAYNWGFDADCNAATLGTIIGVIKGYEWMEKQGWIIKDRYYNNTRPGMPMNETISSFSDRIFNVAQQVIAENGGKKVTENQKSYFLIKAEKPEVLIHPVDAGICFEELKMKYDSFVVNTFRIDSSSNENLIKALYLSFSLKSAEEMKRSYPDQWKKAVRLIQQKEDFMYALYHAAPNYIMSIAKSTGVYPLPITPKLDGKYEFKLEGYEYASSVFLAGTMNHWMQWKNPMAKEGKSWVCRLDLAPDKYEYKFVVDGDWIFDPNQKQEMNFEGNTNSVIEIK